MIAGYVTFDVATVLQIHRMVIDKFGGSRAVRDIELLESALALPWQTFDGKALYPTTLSKAACYAFGISRNHPFMDGNKRVAAAVMGSFLRINTTGFTPSHESLLASMVGVADGSMSREQLEGWLQTTTLQ